MQHRKSVVRPQITQAIAEAREHGDLKENAEYHAAREQQGFNEGRIQEIEGKLADAQVIDVAKIAPSGKVVFGVMVRLIDVESGDEQSYRIVGEDEADIKSGKLSVLSPIAPGADRQKAWATLWKFAHPSGESEYEIDEVSHE